MKLWEVVSSAPGQVVTLLLGVGGLCSGWLAQRSTADVTHRQRDLESFNAVSTRQDSTIERLEAKLEKLELKVEKLQAQLDAAEERERVHQAAVEEKERDRRAWADYASELQVWGAYALSAARAHGLDLDPPPRAHPSPAAAT